jgi:hypothetical protein
MLAARVSLDERPRRRADFHRGPALAAVDRRGKSDAPQQTHEGMGHQATMRTTRRATGMALLIALFCSGANAAELKPATIVAFERYQRAAESAIEADISSPDRFLRVIRGDQARQNEIESQLRHGHVAIARLRVTDAGGRIDVPDGLIHHWVGAAFVPGIHLDAAVSLMEDYDRYARMFRPNIVQSELVERDGDRFQLFLRFKVKKIITVTVDNDSTAEFTRSGPDRVISTIRSTRIAEVENADSPQEREKPVGHGGGYLWRMNTYWRFLERDGGTYIECEALTLSRSIPTGLGWLIGPFVTSVPRDMLTATLEATRRTLLAE